jgi:ATP-binding cassette subfamily A (ABC1) protein 3
LNLNNLFTNLFEDPQNLGSIIIAMLLWCCVYLCMTWYLEKVLPGEYGIALPFYFVLSKSYWFPKIKIPDNLYMATNSTFDDEPKSLRKTVDVQHLTKVI